MAIESHSVAADLSCVVDEDGLENRSTSELVSILRTAFRAKEFDRVEEVLVAKEVKRRKEFETKNKDYELLLSKCKFERLDMLARESTLQEDKVYPKGFETWEQVLKEREDEVKKLKELIVKVDEDRGEKKRELEVSKKSLEVVKKTKEDDRITIEKLNHKNSELEYAIEVFKKTKEDYEKTLEELRCKISELESTMKVVKKTEEDDRKKYDELRRRVSQLENICTMVKNGEPIAPNRNLAGRRGAENDQIENRTVTEDETQNYAQFIFEGTGGYIVEIISDDDYAPAKNLSRARRDQKRKRGSLLNDCDDYDSERDDEEINFLLSESKGRESLKKAGEMFATSPHGRADNHVLNRHISPGTSDSKNIMTSSRAAAVMFRQCAEKVEEECKSHNSKFKYATFSMGYFNEERVISSDSDGDIQNRYGSSHLKSKDQGKRCNKKWEMEAEMRAAFDENDFLCMEAICILYRQSSLSGKARSSCLPSRQRGFNEADMLRGSTLALFLTSGDSQGRLKKSVKELVKFDMCGLIDCRRIAIEHLKQLFEIYKNDEDQFLYQ